MAQSRLALVREVGIGVGRRAHGLIELIAFAGDSVSAKTTDRVGEELRMARRLGTGHFAIAAGPNSHSQIVGGAARLVLVFVASAARATVHTKEVS